MVHLIINRSIYEIWWLELVRQSDTWFPHSFKLSFNSYLLLACYIPGTVHVQKYSSQPSPSLSSDFHSSIERQTRNNVRLRTMLCWKIKQVKRIGDWGGRRWWEGDCCCRGWPRKAQNILCDARDILFLLPQQAEGDGAYLHLLSLLCQVISCYSKDQSCRAYHHFAVVQISLEMWKLSTS